jgi:hypothetical protein
LDFATDLAFENGLAGLEVLGQAADNSILDHKTVRWSDVGRTETVYFKQSSAGGSISARAYDRGVRASIAEPGKLVRFEVQARWTKDHQLSVDEFLALDLQALALAPFESAAADGRWVGTAAGDRAAEMLLVAIEAGIVSRESGFRLIGSQYALRTRSDRWWGRHATAATRRKHRRELAAIAERLTSWSEMQTHGDFEAALHVARDAWGG